MKQADDVCFTGYILLTIMKLFYNVLLAGLAASLTGCLNDDEHYTDFKNVGAVAEIPSSAFYGTLQSRSYLKQTANVDSFDVNIASPNLLTQDVQITVALSQSALTSYNSVNTTNYAVLPANLFQLITPTVTVKAGQRLASVKYQVNTSSLSFSNAYALPFQIVSASNGVVVSGNFATKVIAVVLRNNYEATYVSTGYFTHPNPASSRAINREKSLSSIDETTSETEFADLGAGYTMRLKINADNTVTITPTGSSSTTTSAAGANTYDPATRTFTLNYKYSGSGGDRVIRETLVRE